MQQILVDTREKKPFTDTQAWNGITTEKLALPTGDYTNGKIVIERKGAGDFINCCGKEKARFYRELQRGFDVLIVESDLNGLKNQLRRSRSRMKLPYIIHTIFEIRQEYGCEVILCKDREHAARAALYLLQCN